MAGARVAAARGRTGIDPLQPLWRLLTSVRVAVAFIGGLALVGLAGVLIPQVPEAMRGNDAAVDAWVDAQRDNFGPFTGVMRALGLFSVFQARWFVFALGLLVINVSVCVFNRWAPTFRNVFHPPERVPDTFFANAHNRTVLPAVTPDRMAAALRSMRFGVRTRTDGGATYVFADRYAWAQLATFVSHLAIILFIAGGLVSSLTGFATQAFAGEGTTVPVFAVKDPQQLQVRIDDAVGVYGERGNALDFRTRLTIFRNGEEVKSGVMTVNDPLEYGGYRFHQVAFYPYGAALRVRDAATGNTVLAETFPLEETTAAPRATISAGGETLLSDVFPPTDFLDIASGTLVRVPRLDRTIWVGLTTTPDDEWQLVAFDPQADADGEDLRLAEGESGTMGGAAIRFDGVEGLPSAIGVDVPGEGAQTLVQLVDAGDRRQALLLTSPGQPALALAEGETVEANGYAYTFEGPREFAGVSVKRDQGAWFIWIAAGLLVGGLAITFYVPRRRLWVKLTDGETRIAALAEKSGGFEKDMQTLARRLGVAAPQAQEDR